VRSSEARIVEACLFGSSENLDAVLEQLERAGFKLKRGSRKRSRHNAVDALQICQHQPRVNLECSGRIMANSSV
jgi:hypothetical protein